MSNNNEIEERMEQDLNKELNQGKKEITLKSEGALAEVPVSVEELEKDVALGGKVTLADIGIPFLYILQSNSPQTNPDHPKYIENARGGMLYITVLEKIFDGRDDGLLVVPCFYERLLVEWISRDAGGGLVASYEADDPIKDKVIINEKNQSMLPNGHMLMDTAYWYCLVQIGSTWKQMVAPFKSTALKVSRKWNSGLATTYIPGTEKIAPRFLYKYRFNTIKEQKDSYVWSSPLVKQDEIVSKTLYDAAKDYAKIAAQGILRRKVISAEATHAADAEIPF